MLHQAYKISSNEEIFQLEVNRLRQVFSNNNYPMHVIEKIITNFTREKQSRQEAPQTTGDKIKLYYENQMNNQYKKDEKIMKDIIRKNVKPANENDKMELIIYYRNIKTKDLIMKNNIASNNNDPLSKSWSLYKFTCPHEDCELLTSSYIGMTRNTINKRLEQHCKDGAIKEHLRLKHQQNSTLELLQQNTCPVKQLRDTKRLFIYEALTILKERPFINRQKDNFINPLKLYSRTTTLNQSQPNYSTSTNHTYSLRSRQQL